MPCDGKLTKWRFLDKGKAGTKFVVGVIYFEDDYVWFFYFLSKILYSNYVLVFFKLYVVGYNQLESSGSGDWVEFNVPKDQQLQVRPGMFIAIAPESISDDPVIPMISRDKIQTKGIAMPLSDFIHGPIDYQQLALMVEVGEAFPLPISSILETAHLSPEKLAYWPAIQAVVE